MYIKKLIADVHKQYGSSFWMSFEILHCTWYISFTNTKRTKEKLASRKTKYIKTHYCTEGVYANFTTMAYSKQEMVKDFLPII